MRVPLLSYEPPLPSLSLRRERGGVERGVYKRKGVFNIY